jgi:hypothetical protein
MKKRIVVGIILIIFFFLPIIPSTIVQKIYPPEQNPCCPLGLISQLTPFQFLKEVLFNMVD